jgi:hypothetical protein
VNLAVRDQGSEPGPLTEPRRDTRQASKLLPQLFEGLDSSRRVTVLEVGRALPETVAFFSQFRCKLHVPDLYSALQSGAIDRGSSGRTLQKQFQDLFGFQAGTELDICLLWDFPHYLDEKQLRAFSSALWPWLHTGSRAHLFGVHSAATILLNREYGIVDAQTISVRHRTAAQMKHSPHPQSFMSEWLTCFSSACGVLLGDGKVETLMQSTV